MILKKRSIKGENREIGLGIFGNRGGNKTVNPDGSANIIRAGVAKGLVSNTFHDLITMSWQRFLWVVVFLYLVVNIVFASLYLLAGIENLGIVPSDNLFTDFMEAFFFSTQSLTTVGYGRVNPQGMFANILASIESLCGLMTLALATGLLYGRFSRPSFNFVYSPNMLIAPYKPENHGLMFRFANTRKTQLLDNEVQITMSFDEEDDKGNLIKRYRTLDLELPKVVIFTLSWTVVHPINDKSPLYGLSNADLEEMNAEFLVFYKATDEATSQVIFARYSYLYHELVWGAKFKQATDRADDGRLRIDYTKIGDYDMVELPKIKM